MERKDDNNGFSQWGGYMDAKISKLEEQFSAASDPFRRTHLFKGISIFVNGLTDPSATELKHIMMVHGGVFHHYERPHTTFIIARNLPDVKVRNMNTSKIISAQWVVDCLKEQKILDCTRYLLYTNQKTSQPRINFEKTNANSSKNDKAFKFEGLQSNVFQMNPESIQNGCDNATISKISAKASDELGDTSCLGIFKELQQLQTKMHETTKEKSERLHSSDEKPLKISTVKSKNARTAVDPDFLQEFYNNSRLHHISTLAAGFKQYVGKLRAKHESKIGFPAREQLKRRILSNGTDQALVKLPATCVMHIDMDCFFVSVGLRNHPELRGMPVAVTHSKGGSAAANVPVHPQANRKAEMELFANRFEQHLHDNIRTDKVRSGFDSKMSLSEIASCSYEARAKGIRNGMFVGAAIKLCPDLKTIPYNFEGYREVAFTLYNTVAQYTLNIEAVSCDEMFVELSDLLRELRLAPMDFVSALRQEVRKMTGCPCSAGVGTNKLQARMATKRAKPDGQFMLSDQDVAAYMAPIPIEELPGIGGSTAYTLKQSTLLTCGDLQQLSLAKIQMLLGKKLGNAIYHNCRGIDNRQLVFDQVRISVSSELNYGIRFKNFGECEKFLLQLSAEVHKRLKGENRKAKRVKLKVMVRAQDAPIETSKFMGHGVCASLSKSTTLSDFTDDLDKITQTVLSIMKALNTAPQELRGLGIQLSKLDEPKQQTVKKDNAIMNMFNKVSAKLKEKNTIASAEPCDFLVNEEIKIAPQAAEEKQNQPVPVRKRGRPPKIGAPEKKVPKKQPTVLNMLQKAAVTNKEKASIPAITLPSDIDYEVLAELPEEIRNEIIQEHALNVARPPTIETPKNVREVPLNGTDFGPSTSKAAAEKLLLSEQSVQDVQQNAVQADPQFLAALPPDLRMDVKKELRQQNAAVQYGTGNGPSSSNKENRPLTAVKHRTSEKCETPEEKPTAKQPTDNIFLKKNFIKIILDWVKVQSPCDYDIDVVANHACEMVQLNQLDELYNGMLYLCRIINSHRGTREFCKWHLGYKMIESALQLQMRLSHNGKELKLGDSLHCTKCRL